MLLLGASGCGKTTLLSALAALLTPARGSIQLDDVEVTELRGKALAEYRKRTVGVVYQAFNLIPSLNALDNVAVPAWNAGDRARGPGPGPPGARGARAREAPEALARTTSRAASSSASRSRARCA